MFKPLGSRCIVKINKRYLVDEKNKPVLDEHGNQHFEQEQECTVIESNIEGLKKGAVVIPIIRGGVPILKEETKKYAVYIIDFEDIYGIKK